MPTLKQARKGKIEEFIKEHEADPDGDLDKLDALIKRPIQGNEKATRPTSPQASFVAMLSRRDKLWAILDWVEAMDVDGEMRENVESIRKAYKSLRP